MIQILTTTLLSVALLGLAGAASADDETRTLRCPVSGQPAKDTVTADWHGGKVSFCCPRCADAFARDNARYAAKANLQLLLSGQARQKACPMGFQKVKEGVVLDVGGVALGLCCGRCKGAGEKLQGDERVAKFFDDKNFDRAFEIPPKEE